MTILVTGGTGRLGRPTVAALQERGHEVRVFSRRPGPGRTVGDLDTGAGLDPALEGADTVVHLATTARNDERHTRVLLDALEGSGRHLVFVSIVGVDRVPLAYYRSKLATERAIAASGLAHTVIRVTQFHDFVTMFLDPQRRLPVTLVIPALVQPIDVTDVARRLVELVEAGPSGRVADLAGPEVRSLAELAREWQQAAGVRRPIWTAPLPGKTGTAVRGGGLTAGLPAAGRRTFREHLASRSAR